MSKFSRGNMPADANEDHFSFSCVGFENASPAEKTLTKRLTITNHASTNTAMNFHKSISRVIFMILFSFAFTQGFAQENAINFDNTDDFVSVPSDAAFDFGMGDFTVETWIKTTDTGVLQVPVGRIGGGNFWLGVFSTNKARFSISGGADCSSTTSVNDGNWHHVAGVRASGVIYLYVDGVLEASVANALSAPSSGIFSIGNFDGQYWFNGDVDNVRIWNTARTNAQLDANATNTLISETGLVASYSFNNITGQATVSDLTANAHDGTWSGTGGTNTSATYVSSTALSTTGLQDIFVSGNSVEIVDADASPDAADDTYFGLQLASSGTVVKTFTIYNDGLNTLGSIAASVGGGTGFSVTSSPTTSLAPGISTTFDVTFDPASTGTLADIVIITSDDPTAGEGSYTFSISGVGTNPTTLTQGDLAFVSVNPTVDAFAVVLLKSIEPGTEILFTDKAWDGTAQRSGEGIITFTTTEDISEGDILYFDEPNLLVNQEADGSSAGALVTTFGTFAYNDAGDQVFAYQGDGSSASHYLSAINTNPGGFISGVPDAQSSQLPSTLIEGKTAIDLASINDGYYSNATVTSTVSGLRNLINGDPATNWTTTGGPFDLTDFATVFTIQANVVATTSDFVKASGLSTILSLSTSDFAITTGNTGEGLESITITTEPTSGNLFLDLDLNNTDDGGGETINDASVVTVQQLDAGYLKYTAASTHGSETFSFTVSDGEASSTPANTATLWSVENALDFDGTDNYVSSSTTITSTSGTWEAWVKKDDWATGHNHDLLFGNGIDVNTDNAFYITLHTSVGLHFRYGGISQTGNGYVATTSTQALSAGSWHHIAATWNVAGTVTLQLYLDGELQATSTSTSTIAFGATSYFGGLPSALTDLDYFGTGEIDEIRIWNDERTAAEIRGTASSRLANPTGEANLVAYYDFNVGLPALDNSATGLNITSIADESSNSNTGTLNGFTLTAGTTSNFIASSAFASTAATTAEITLTASTFDLADGGTWNFGAKAKSTNNDQVFTITNIGLGTLSGLSTSLAVTDGTHYSIQSQPTQTSLSGGGSDNFTVRLTPLASGTLSTDLGTTLTNSDSNENPFNLNFTATGVNTVPTAADATLATGINSIYTFSALDFGYADVDPADGLETIEITTEPASGNLFIDISGNDTDDGGSEEINDLTTVTKAQIDAGFLKYAASSTHGSETFTFKVSDGDAFSIAANTGTAWSVDNALDLDGTNDFLDIPIIDLSAGDALTVEAWIKPNSFPSAQTSIIRQETGAGAEFFMGFNSSGSLLRLAVNTGSPTQHSVTVTPAYFTDGDWHHVAGVYDGTDIRIYVDGVETGTPTAKTGNLVHNTSGHSNIGAYNNGALEFFNGGIDEVRIWSTARTAGEILTNVNTTLTVVTGLEASYNFNEGVPGGSNAAILTLNDESGNARNGTLADGSADVGASGFLLSGAVSNWVASTALSTDITPPTNQDVVYASSSTRNGGGTVTIVSSAEVTNEVWFAPSGTTTFTEGATMTKATDGTSTSILAPATAGTYKVYVIDASNNVSDESLATLTVENTAPTAAITYSPTGSYNSGTSVTITATFDEDMADAPVPQITISGSDSDGPAAMSKSSATVYTYSYSAGAGDGAATVSLSVGTDLAGNLITSAPTSGATFTLDNTAPTPVITSTSSSPTNDNPIPLNVDFGEAVTGFTSGDVSPTNGTISNFGIVNNYSYDSQFGGTGAADGQFNFPSAIAIDNDGDIWVADLTNGDVQEFNSAGVFQKSISLGAAHGVAVDASNNIYVIQYTTSSVVSKYNNAGVFQSSIGTSSTSNVAGQIWNPWDIEVDQATGDIYVADYSSDKVLKYNSAGTFQFEFGTSGSGDGQFTAPYGMAIIGNSIYVGDEFPNNRVNVFDKTDGSYLFTFGSNGTGDGQFLAPDDITTDGSLIYVADRNGHRKEVFTASGAFITKYGTSGSGNGQFSFPRGIAIDASGNLLIADEGNDRVQKILATPTGEYVMDLNPSGDGTVNADIAGSAADDLAGNNSNAASQFSITYDATAPAFNSTPTLIQTGPGAIQVAVNLDESGTVYYVVSDNASAPTAANVKLGVTGGAGTILVANNFAYTTGSAQSDPQTSLTLANGTSYYAHLVSEDVSNNQVTASSIALVSDVIAPVATLAVVGTPAANATGILVDVDFNEDANGLVIGSFDITPTGVVLGTAVLGNDGDADDKTYQITIPITSGAGSISIDLNGTSVVLDDLGNGSNTPVGIYATSAGAENHTVDLVAPTFNSTPTLSQTAGDAIQVEVDLDESGTIWYVVTTSASPPAANDIKTPVGGELTTGTFAYTTGSSQTDDKSSLAVIGGTSYYAHFVAEDALTNQSTSSSVVMVASATAPIVVTAAESSVGASSATLNGTISSDGGATITVRGFVYSLASIDANPTVAEANGTTIINLIEGLATTGSFSSAITGLTGGSGYSYISYATNSLGTTEGGIETFTTLPDVIIPTVVVTPNAVTNGSMTGTNDGAASFDIAFSEPIVGFTLSDDIILLNVGVTIVGSILVNDGDDRNYTLNLTGITGDGDITITIDNAGTINAIADLAGNNLGTSVGPSTAITVDNAFPTAAITYSVAGPYKSADAVTITATFNEDMEDSPVP
ncbi:MAG: hypothetical protein ACI8TA_000459, partial [Cyclobacteriaceae bacterium]